MLDLGVLADWIFLLIIAGGIITALVVMFMPEKEQVAKHEDGLDHSGGSSWDAYDQNYVNYEDSASQTYEPAEPAESETSSAPIFNFVWGYDDNETDLDDDLAFEDD